MNKKIYGLTMGAIALGFMASCSNDVKNDPATPEGSDKLTMEIAAAPEVAIWSGDGTFVGSRSGEEGTTKGTTKYENDEVEINLSVNDIHRLPNGAQKYDIEDLVSHLSIHVRSVTDVEVTLPVPAAYYCDQDDVYIYNEREEKGTLPSDVVFNGTSHEVSYDFKWKVPGEGDAQVDKVQKVKVLVTFNAPTGGEDNEEGDNNEGSITVKVSGVTKDLLDYCKAEYGDGVNFDIYNYYNRGNQYATGSYAKWTLPQLLGVLNDSQVNFTTAPDYYINAFTGDVIKYTNKTGDVENYYRDCWVVPTNAEDTYWNPTYGHHNKNHVYLKKAKFPNAQGGEVVEGADSGLVPTSAEETTPDGE